MVNMKKQNMVNEMKLNMDDVVDRSVIAMMEVKELNVFNVSSLLMSITGIDKEFWFDKLAEAFGIENG